MFAISLAPSVTANDSMPTHLQATCRRRFATLETLLPDWGVHWLSTRPRNTFSATTKPISLSDANIAIIGGAPKQGIDDLASIWIRSPRTSLSHPTRANFQHRHAGSECRL